jgi:Putative zinc binding domain
VFSQKNLEPLNECLACGSERLKLTLDLGEQPLANSYKDSQFEAQEVFPLAINRCEECFHVQLTHAVNPDLMFKEYLYVSGTSHTMREHFKWFANYTREMFLLYNRHSAFKILDIGCNDGSQLDAFQAAGAPYTFGVDPAENLAETSKSKGHTIFVDYFDLDFAKICAQL